MKKLLSLLLALSCLMLFGCAKEPAPTETPAPTPVPTTEAPTTVPETTVPPTTEAADPILEAGPTITVDGIDLTTVLYMDTAYMSASEFLNCAEDVTFTGDHEAGFSAEKNGVSYEFFPDQETYVKNGLTIAAALPVLTNYHTIYLPVLQTCEEFGISILEDPELHHIYCTSAASAVEIEPGVRIPILMYHGVTDNLWGSSELFVSPSDFDAQVKYLVDNGYDPITFEDWDHLEDFDKPVMLTFDDGYMDNYEEAFPILQKYNVRATIFLITISVDRDPRTMTSEQAREMMDSGLVSIQSHTATHPHLSQCSEEELDTQIRLSRLAVARICGREPFVLCYPYGDSSPRSRELTLEYYNYGILMTGGTYTTGGPLDQITRHYVPRGLSLSAFASMVSGAGR